MKVVLFCGGLGMRMREFSEAVPKPLVPLGTHPILWHVMRYYAHYGHKDFILCLGYKSELIRAFIDGMRGQLSPEFTSAFAGLPFAFPDESSADWNITCIDTGLEACVGERLRAVQALVASEDIFLANYVDGLADISLPAMIERFARSDKTACFASVCPQATFHLVETESDGTVTGIDHIRSGRHRINGGFFVFRQGIFEMVKEGEDLVEMPFQRLLETRRLMAYRHDGFWACMDTFREKQVLEDYFASRRAPWMVWQKRS